MLTKLLRNTGIFGLLFIHAITNAQNCSGFGLSISGTDTSICGQPVSLTAHASSSGQSSYDTINLQSWFNANWIDETFSMAIPSGYDTLGGVPFLLGCDTCNNYWEADLETGPNPIILAVPAHQRIDSVFALVNTYWGATGGPYAYIELKSNAQNLFQKDLYGDTDIRDFHPNTFTNTINGTSTVNVFLNAGLDRLDMVKAAIPAQFQDSIIDSILFVDNGGNGISQRLVVTGLTLHVVPDTAVSYIWSTGDTTPTINVNPVQTTTYYVTATTPQNNCSLTDSVKVIVVPDTNVAVSANGPVSFCTGDSTQICASQGFDSYAWNTGQTTSCIAVVNAGNYYVTVTETGGCSVTSNHVSITVLPAPSVSLSISGDTLTAFNAVAYQWYLNDSFLLGDTAGVLIATISGTYTVQVTGANGCSSLSNGQLIKLTEIGGLQEALGLKLYPDPATDELNVSYSLNEPANLQITITDVTGQIIQNVLGEKELSGTYLRHIRLNNIAAGAYILNFLTENGTVNLRFLKE